MTDNTQGQGLSIFDEPTEETPSAQPPAAVSDAETQVFASVATTLPQPKRSQLPAALPVPEFAVVRRGGYDRAAVDGWLAGYQLQQSNTAAEFQALQEETAYLRRQVAELQSRLSEQENPTYSGLGSHAAALLRIAEEQANAVTAEARRAADDARQRSLVESAALRADAEKEASDIRATQLQEIQERRESLLGEAKQELESAEAEAADRLASAARESEQLKLAAQQEANTLRTAAKREAEQVRAAADREAMESRRMLAVEKERLTKEAAERHTSATAEAARLVEGAEARADRAEERTRQAIATAAKHRQQAAAESEKSLARAQREGEQIVAAARKRAEQIVMNATADGERRHAAVRAEVELLQRRRDGIVTQLAQLRDLVASFTGADIPVTQPAGGPKAEAPGDETAEFPGGSTGESPSNEAAQSPGGATQLMSASELPPPRN